MTCCSIKAADSVEIENITATWTCLKAYSSLIPYFWLQPCTVIQCEELQLMRWLRIHELAQSWWNDQTCVKGSRVKTFDRLCLRHRFDPTRTICLTLDYIYIICCWDMKQWSESAATLFYSSRPRWRTAHNTNKPNSTQELKTTTSHELNSKSLPVKWEFGNLLILIISHLLEIYSTYVSYRGTSGLKVHKPQGFTNSQTRTQAKIAGTWGESPSSCTSEQLQRHVQQYYVTASRRTSLH